MTGIIDISGSWKAALDKDQTGKCPVFDSDIELPGTTSCAGLGEGNPERETGSLTDLHKFEGDAWFTRTVDLTAAVGKTAKVFFERTRMTRLFIDDKEVGSFDSLTTPHIYDITSYVTAGEHSITVCVSNKGYPTAGGHLTSKDTQSNWNGITGEMSIRLYGERYADDVRVYPIADEKAFRIHAKVIGGCSGKAVISAESFNYPQGAVKHSPEPVTLLYNGGEILVTLPLGNDARFWDEYSPELYRITIDIDGDKTSVTAGLREFKTDGDKFTINGRKTFLRGKHDGMIFPKTGYAPTDVESWLRVLSISRSYGMNHYRFHTCCPPEAAFEAADLLGIYMEPQLPFWGTIHAPEDEDFDQAEQEHLIAEGFRMLKTFGNHPSFCLMSLGNELWGSKERLNDILGEYKKFDSRHLYTQGSNNFQWYPSVLENDDFFVGVRLSKDRLLRGSYAMCDAPLGHIQTEKPSTLHDYDGMILPERTAESTEASSDGTVQIQYGTTMKTVKAADADADFIPKVPIITHEIGQFETFPNFDEIKKYTGPLKPRNLEIFRERLEQRGLLPLGKQLFKASGELAVLCYKEEMESVFRSKRLGGFQILDIQDFQGQGTALVGVLDAFMDEKGICSPERWREFCNDTVLLARFDSYCLEAGKDLSAAISITNFSPADLSGKTVTAKITDENGSLLLDTELTVPDTRENYIELGKIVSTVKDIKKPQRLKFTLELNGTDIKNHYDLFAYPHIGSIDTEGAYIFTSENEEARELMENGRTVLITPELTDKEFISRSIEGFWCQDFWCYPMFSAISDMMNKPRPVGTMGLLIDNSHPILSDFPCDISSGPQWWDIVMNSRSEILDGRSEGKKVIIRTIDNFDRCHDLALMYEYNYGNGKAVVLNADIQKIASSPEGRQFVASVIGYIKSCNI